MPVCLNLLYIINCKELWVMFSCFLISSLSVCCREPEPLGVGVLGLAAAGHRGYPGAGARQEQEARGHGAALRHQLLLGVCRSGAWWEQHDSML